MDSLIPSTEEVLWLSQAFLMFSVGIYLENGPRKSIFSTLLAPGAIFVDMVIRPGSSHSVKLDSRKTSYITLHFIDLDQDPI